MTAKELICNKMYDFTNSNWDKIDRGKVELNDSRNKFLKKVKNNLEEALWVLFEVAAWGMDKIYLEELFIDQDNGDFNIIKINDVYIKIISNEDYSYTVEIIKPKTKEVIYFD